MGNPLISGKSRLVKYYNLARFLSDLSLLRSKPFLLPRVSVGKGSNITRVSMEVIGSRSLVSWFITYVQDLNPSYIGVIIHLLY